MHSERLGFERERESKKMWCDRCGVVAVVFVSFVVENEGGWRRWRAFLCEEIPANCLPHVLRMLFEICVAALSKYFLGRDNRIAFANAALVNDIEFVGLVTGAAGRSAVATVVLMVNTEIAIALHIRLVRLVDGVHPIFVCFVCVSIRR